MRVLLLNLGVDSLQAANSSLASQGYDVATNRGLAVDQVLALSPEVLVAEVTPSDLSCCGLIAQLKARPETESSLKIVMVVQGGAVERARALDLGADDVISFPFEPVEFAARIRAQFRERKLARRAQDHAQVRRATRAFRGYRPPIAYQSSWQTPLVAVIEEKPSMAPARSW